MAQLTVALESAPGYLFLPPLGTHLAEVLADTLALARSRPDLLALIHADQEAEARRKKGQRLADRAYVPPTQPEWAWPWAPVVALPGDGHRLTLATGRSRLPPLAVLVLRGHYGNLGRSDGYARLRESYSLRRWFAAQGWRWPAYNTVADNLRVVGEATRQAVVTAQLQAVQAAGLDDFRELIPDSTHVAANSAWPTDSGLLLGLLERTARGFTRLARDGVWRLPAWGWESRWLQQLRRTHLQLQLAGGRTRRGRRRRYGEHLDLAAKLLARFSDAWDQVDETFVPAAWRPTHRQRHRRLLDRLLADLMAVDDLIAAAYRRVFQGQRPSPTERVLSLADPDAAMIVKGGRQPVLGYRVTLGRSARGFVSTLLVPTGNVADSTQLAPAVRDSCRRTGVVPVTVSAVDGFSSAAHDAPPGRADGEPERGQGPAVDRRGGLAERRLRGVAPAT